MLENLLKTTCNKNTYITLIITSHINILLQEEFAKSFAMKNVEARGKGSQRTFFLRNSPQLYMALFAKDSAFRKKLCG